MALAAVTIGVISVGFNVNYKALGLSSSVNELESPEGALSVADNVLVTKDDVIESRPGFEACQTGLPATKPLQMFAGKGRLFVHSSGSIYYKDVSSCSHTAMSGATAGLGNFGHFFYYPGDRTIYHSQSFYSNMRKLSLGTRYVADYVGRFLVNGYSDGAALSSRFHVLASSYRSGNSLYMSDQFNALIRKLDIPTNTVSTVAGTFGFAGSVDGIGAAARFNAVSGMVGDGTHIYIIDNLNYTLRRYTIATANVLTVAGSAGVPGTADGIGAAARFTLVTHPTSYNTAMCISGTDIYMADQYAIRHIDSATFQVTTLAGSITSSGDTDADGTSARFDSPYGMACDLNFVYFSDKVNNKIKRMSRIAPYTVTTIAGDGTPLYQDGVGVYAKIKQPGALTIVDNVLYFTSDLYLLRTLDLSTLQVNSLTDNVTGLVDGYISESIVGPD